MHPTETQNITKLSEDLSSSSVSHIFDGFAMPVMVISSILIFGLTVYAVRRIWQRRMRL